ncbi:restriction endonuclease subunit S [Yersinia pestis]|nr:restriction endonuclease subunit S [Yersinia pestis]
MKNANEWVEKSLFDLAQYINGYAFKPEDWGKDGLPIIRIEQLKKPDGPADYYSGKIATAYVVEDGDLLFSWSASLFLSIWKHGQAVLNQHIFKVLEHEGVDRLFLKYFIEFHLPELIKASHGSTMQHITRKELERFKAIFPISLTEQTKIAEILLTVDRAIEQTELMIAKQRRIKTGLMQDLLKRGIDKHGNVRSIQENQFKDSPLGRIPEEWGVMKFEDITPINSPIGYGIVQPGSYDYTGVKVAGIYTINSDFQRWHMSSNKIEQAYTRSRIRPGDVLLSVKGTIGRVGVVPEGINGNISREIARIRPVESINPYFLRLLMLSDFFQKYLGDAEVGTTRAEISIKILRNLYVVVPPLPEQNEIAFRISQFELHIENLQRELAKLQSLKKGLMQGLVTGKFRVNSLLRSESEVMSQ